MTGGRGRDKGEAEATAVANGDRLDNDLWDKVGDGVEERCPEDVGLCAIGMPETADICGYLVCRKEKKPKLPTAGRKAE